MRYRTEGMPLVIVAGREYGTGFSRDWVAKGTLLLGIRAVISENFARIRRSNLVGMGIAPLQFLDGKNRESLGLTSEERVSTRGPSALSSPRKTVHATLTRADGSMREVELLCRTDTDTEIE